MLRWNVVQNVTKSLFIETWAEVRKLTRNVEAPRDQQQSESATIYRHKGKALVSWDLGRPGVVEGGLPENGAAVIASPSQGGSWGENSPTPISSYPPVFSNARGQGNLCLVHIGLSPRTQNRAEKDGTWVSTGGT